MTTDTTTNLQGAHLTGALLGLLKHGQLRGDDFAALCYALRYAHKHFPSASSAETLAEVDTIEHDRLRHELELRRRDELERFRDLDGDHEYERAERGPEHEYPR